MNEFPVEELLQFSLQIFTSVYPGFVFETIANAETVYILQAYMQKSFFHKNN